MKTKKIKCIENGGSDLRTVDTLTAVVKIDGVKYEMSNNAIRWMCHLIINDINADGNINGLFGALQDEGYWKLAKIKSES